MGLEKFVARVLNSRLIGGGAAKNVYVHPDKPHHVVGVYHDEEYDGREEMHGNISLKSIFYTQKIAHLLFPEHVPNIHKVVSRPSLVEKHRTHDSRNMGDFGTSPDCKELITKLWDAGLPIDSTEENFERDADGRVVYVDDFAVNPSSFTSAQRELLRQAILTRLSGDAQEKALRYLERIPTQT